MLIMGWQWLNDNDGVALSSRMTMMGWQQWYDNDGVSVVGW